MEEKDLLGLMLGQNQIQKVMEINQQTERFGLVLTKEDAKVLVESRKNELQKQFFNICSIILRHILGHMMIEKKLGEEGSEEDYELLKKRILEDDLQHLVKHLEEYLFRLIEEKYSADSSLESYLSHDLENFSLEMYAAAENNSLRYVVAL